MKVQADKKRRNVEFQVGDMVLVKLQPYSQLSLALQKNQNLGMRYFGPFPIIEKIGTVAYKLKLPDTTRTHPIFHVSVLKLFKGDYATSYIHFTIA
uniref:Tf2-1-like SH3-like domain-containing protein n=1 Tax=Cajanus cajan TaxID=3821 RepID=A0A151QW45_CAJCA|nr:hypothetical protein KK1_044569 [Cajanus cajan]